MKKAAAFATAFLSNLRFTDSLEGNAEHRTADQLVTEGEAVGTKIERCSHKRGQPCVFDEAPVE